MARLSIRLLGGFQVDLDGVPVTDFKSDKVRALLSFLAVEGDRPHPRDSLAWLLWPDMPDQAALTNLRSTLANLRKVINDHGALPPHLIISRETIQFNKNSDYWLDALALMSVPIEMLLKQCQVEQSEQALTLYRGEFLRGFSLKDSPTFEEWTLLKREQTSRRVIELLHGLATFYEQHNDFEKAQTHTRKMVELEPWNEEAHQQLMRALAAGGQRSAALAHYEACRRILSKELGVEPSRETIMLYQAIRDENIETLLPALSPVSTIPMGGLRPRFVGRQPELDKLNGFLEKTLAGQGQVALVTGSAGSGKTALVAEFVQRALLAHAGLIPVSGGCNIYTGIGDPYQPFQEILGLLTGDMTAKRSGWSISPQHTRRILALLPAAIQALVEFGPDLIDRVISGPALIDRAQTIPHGGGALAAQIKALLEKRKMSVGDARLKQIDLFEQITRVMQALAQRHPLILVIDDLQWADSGSISLLYHLSQHLVGSRVLIVGAFRPEDLALGRDGGRHPLEPALSEIQRNLGAIQVNLDQSDGLEFVEAYLDSEPNRLGPEFCQTLLHHTSGHPLFTIELLRSLQEGGDLLRDETGRWTEGKHLSWDKLPARAEAVVAERMGRLPLDLRQALEVASVEGEEFTAEVAAEVLSTDEGYLVRQLSEQLDRMHHLVAATQSRRLDGQRISRYRFQNHLFQTYLYDSLDEVERAYFHERVGLALEKYYQERAEEINAISAQLARHFQRAGDPLKAIQYLRICGKRAEQLSASHEAIAFFGNALALCPEIPDELVRAQTELDLTMALSGQYNATVGIASLETAKLYARARQLCQELGKQIDDPKEAAKRLVPALVGLGGHSIHLAKFQLARENYDQAMALAQACGDPEALMLSHWGRGVLMVQVGECISARSHLEQALEIYAAHKLQGSYRVFTLDMVVSCNSWLSWALFFLGYPDQAQQRSAEAVAKARQLSHPLSLAVALTIAAILDCLALDWQGALDLAGEAIPIGRKRGFTFWLANALTSHGQALACQGQYQAGMLEMEEGFRIWRASGDEVGLQGTLIHQADVFRNAGFIEQGMAALAQPIERIKLSGEALEVAEHFRIKGDLLLMLSNENQAEAEACYHQAIEVARQQHAKILELRSTTALSKLLIGQGKRDEARERLRNIYSWFTEGFGTQDLQSASRLLEELS
jgi:DNA-binding SARP family transcriptional activator/predicted negative regulator of RcsB-dependent stress response